VAIIAATSAGVPAATEVSKVILALLGLQDAQSAMLDHIRRDVELLRAGPFRAAQEQLAIANRKSSVDAEYQHHLQRAVDLLVDALGQSASVEESSVIRFNLGVVAAVSGDAAEARHRLAESYRDCVSVVEELVTRTTDIKIIKSRWTASAAAMPGGITYIGIVKFLKALKAQDAAIALESYVPFVNTVAQTSNATEKVARNPGLRLQGTFQEGYELEWTAPQR
jgi:hypothetical protein